LPLPSLPAFFLPRVHPPLCEQIGKGEFVLWIPVAGLQSLRFGINKPTDKFHCLQGQRGAEIR
jgi:hypothetical protein